MSEQQHLSPWKDYTVSTAIILPTLFWISVIGKWLIGFNLLYWVVWLLNMAGRFGSIEDLDRTEIDDPVILMIGAGATACLGVVAFFRLRDYRLLRTRGIKIEGEVKRVSWIGDQPTVSFRYKNGNRTFATRMTLPTDTGRAAEQSGRIALLIDPKSPRRCVVLNPQRAITGGEAEIGSESA
jgi:hypothetical protein